jgi:uncharacterized protein (DUF1330 family)
VAQASNTPAGLTLVALIYLHPGSDEAFERFETAAGRIMMRHGGRIDRRIRFGAAGEAANAGPASGAVTGGATVRSPDEIHIVQFPDEASFASYRADPELLALADLRASAIRETVIWRGAEAAPFHAP